MLDFLYRAIDHAGPVVTIICATLLVVVGVLIVLYPVILAWIVGVVLVLAGLAVLGMMLGSLLRTSQQTSRPPDDQMTQHHNP